MKLLRKRPLLRKTVATGMFTFGLVSLILPLLPGWIMIGFALYLFLLDAPHLQARLAVYRAKYPRLDSILKKTYDKVHKEPAPEAPLSVTTP